MKDTQLSYIAGFLDGDGCIMLQLVYRKDYRLGYQIRASIVFYQKQQYRDYLVWLKDTFQCGYVRSRNDGMCEYTIVQKDDVAGVLNLLSPYIILKKKQAKLALSIIARMPGKGRSMDAQLLLDLSKEVDRFSSLNYSKNRKNTSVQVREFLESHNLTESRRD
jgi:intein-encoded DNA endonuclease-like protein